MQGLQATPAVQGENDAPQEVEGKAMLNKQTNMAQVKEKQILFIFSLLNSFVRGRRLGDTTAKYTLSQTEIFLST